MAPSLSQEIAKRAEEANKIYHRLVIVVGPARTGKTAALRDLHAERNWPLVNINLTLSEKLLDLTLRQRALRAARLVDDIVEEQASDIVLLDNIEMLFQPDLELDPLRLLQSLARNRTIIAAWRGVLVGTSLTYAAPEHPEYRRYDDPETLLVPTVASRQ